MESKYCKHCDTIKPIGEFGKKEKTSDGLQGWCKECHRSYTKEKQRNPKPPITIDRKICYRCKIEKTTDHFHHSNRNADRLQGVCKECCTERNKSNYIKKPPRPFKDSASSQYYVEYRTAHAQEIAERRAKWYKENKDKARTRNSNRRARIQNAEGSHTAKEVRELFSKQNGLCFWCDVKLINPFVEEAKSGSIAHLDHAIPLVRGGSNWISNLVWSCQKCNLSKHHRLPSEWAGSNGRWKE